MSSERPRLPVVALVSGRGSNLQAIVDAAARGAIAVDLRAVFSDRAEAPGLEIARSRGIHAEHVSPREHADRQAFDAALAARIEPHAPGLLVLAGYMRILGPAFVGRYAGRVLNIHPSLLPRHPGLNTHRRVLEAGDAEHGASVHFVTAQLDAGPVIVQGRLRVQRDDDERTLASRVLALEHRIYPQAVGWFADGRLESRGDAAWLDGARLERPMQLVENGNAFEPG